jgi:RimJ/RimL family protein N-acetyltransferase
MGTDFPPFARHEVELLADLLTEEQWPYHSGAAVDRDTVRRRVADGYYDGSSVRTFWIMEDGERVGLIRLEDIDDDTPMFDLRIRAGCRGRGNGKRAVDWLTDYLFTTLPDVSRVEGTTRADNRAMRRVFRHCGYAKEAHYRDGWPTAGGAVRDAVGYAILRRDWVAGTVTTPNWDDEDVGMAPHE